MSDIVLDASAILALAFSEPGAERVSSTLARAAVSAVNLSEACAKMIDKGFPAREAEAWLTTLSIRTIPFAVEHAHAAAALRSEKAHKVLSFADRACIATAAAERGVALTTDRAWADFNLPCEVELIRK